MAYKGEDLDLRTPPSIGTARGQGAVEPVPNGTHRQSNGAGQQGRTAREEPIWVDEVLLACCNHAFDVAFAHRAAEVRIEHLLYAITRVDAATEVLESNGVRDAGLRRESAMVIASGIPAGTVGSTNKPRESVAVKEALKLASAHAANFNLAAGIGDLLHVFTVLRPDLPGLDLLHRHKNTAPSPQQHSFSAPISPVQPPSPQHTSSDAMQDTRLEALEQLVRALGQDIALERQAHAGSVHQDSQLNYTTVPPPPQTPRSTSVSLPNSQRADTGFSAQLEQISNQLGRLDARINSLEHSLSTDQFDLSPIDTRLNDIEVALLSADGSTDVGGRLGETLEDLRENFAHSIDNVRHILNERIDKLHENTSSQFTAVHSELTGSRTAQEEVGAAISAELKALAGASSTHAASAERNLSGVREGVGAISEKIAKLEADNQETRSNFVDELREVHDAVMKLNTNQHTLAESITNWHQDHVRDLESISARLLTIDGNTSKPLDEIQKVSSNVANLSANMDAMYRVTIERYHRRNRFWFWLFGTDDWVGASWPSQTARIEDELRALKTIRDRD